MTSERSRGLLLLALSLLAGLLALVLLTAVALARAPDTSTMSIALPIASATVVEAVRTVCADGVIRGTAQYESDDVLAGAKESTSSASFPRWAGAGEVFYKTRPGAIAPSHFAGTRDRGEVTVRYVVEPQSGDHTLITIDAVFVEDTHHGRHFSQGFVERAEFGEIAKQLKYSGAIGLGPAPEAPAREPKPRDLGHTVEDSGTHLKVEPNQAAPAAAEVRSAAVVRSFTRAEDVLKKALRELGAFDGDALPTLEGFAALDPEQLIRCDHPYYQFRVAFEPAGSGLTMVRVEAVVTARCADAAGSRPEYRSVPSNGRLEADLFDRLDGYLRTGAPASGAAALRQPAAKTAEKN
jgi:hypothetical protein